MGTTTSGAVPGPQPTSTAPITESTMPIRLWRDNNNNNREVGDGQGNKHSSTH